MSSLSRLNIWSAQVDAYFLTYDPIYRALHSQGLTLRLVQCKRVPGTSPYRCNVFRQQVCEATLCQVITRPSCFKGMDIKSKKSRDARNWMQMFAGVCVTEFQGTWGLHRKTRVIAQGRLRLFTEVEDRVQICTIPLQLLASFYQG